MTLMSSQGACHSGLGCWIFSRRMRLEDGRPPFVLAFKLKGVLDFRKARAVDDLPCVSDFCGMPSIIFKVADSGLPCWGFFRRAAAAVFCFAASAGGSSRTSSYSFRMRDANPTLSARRSGSSGGKLPMYGAGIVYSEPKSCLVFWAEVRASRSDEGRVEAMVVGFYGCYSRML